MAGVAESDGGDEFSPFRSSRRKLGSGPLNQASLWLAARRDRQPKAGHGHDDEGWFTTAPKRVTGHSDEVCGGPPAPQVSWLLAHGN